jgi:membrane protease YdiL (CAAX protease family)
MSSQHALHGSRHPHSPLPERGSPIRWRDVILFVVLAYGIAWAIWSPLAPKIADSLKAGHAPTEFQASAGVLIGMYAPALAALIMRLFISREGLRDSVGPRPRLWSWIAAVVVPMLFIFAVVAVVVILRGSDVFAPGKSFTVLLPVLLVIGVPVGAILAFGEEFGWRGYLLRKLLPLGEFKAAVIVGVIWGMWHLPILVVGLNYPGENLAVLVAVFLVATVLLSMLHTRFYILSGGSVIVTAILHGSLNTFSDRLTDSKHLTGNPLVVGGGGVIAIAIAAIASLITARWLRHRRLRGEELLTELTDLTNR